MMNYLTRLLTAALLSLALCASAVAEFSSLEERMTGTEWDTAGLNKLSPAELEALNGWLRQFINQEIRSAGGSDPNAWVGLTRPESEPRLIESRLVGDFTGWTGKTVFELENGQVWRQTRHSTFRHKTLSNPKVQITPESLGTFALRVEGLNRSVRVERVR